MENLANKMRAKIEALNVEAVKKMIIDLMDSEEDYADVLLSIAIANLEKRVSVEEFVAFSNAI